MIIKCYLRHDLLHCMLQYYCCGGTILLNEYTVKVSHAAATAAVPKQKV